MGRGDRLIDHPEDTVLVSFVAEFSEVEEALADADTIDEALTAMERSLDVFAQHTADLEASGSPVYDTASEMFLEFRKRAYLRVAEL